MGYNGPGEADLSRRGAEGVMARWGSGKPGIDWGETITEPITWGVMADEPKGMTPLGDEYHLDEHGVVYERWGDALLRPVRWVPGGRALPPWAATQASAPYRCSGCGTDRLLVFESGDRETSVMCPDCGTEAVVHEG